MRTAVIVGFLLSTTAAASPLRLVTPGLRVTNLKASLVQDFTDHLAAQLSERGLTVVTASDVQQVLSLERQRQLLGCADDATSCITELAGALGADGVVTGTIVRLSKRFQVNVRVIDAHSAKALAVFSEQVDREDELFSALSRAAQKVAADLAPLIQARSQQVVVPTAPPPVPSVSTPTVTPPGTRRLWWIPALTGGLLCGSAVLGFAIAGDASRALRSTMGATVDTFDLSATIRRGQTFQALGWVSAGLAGASIIAMGALLLFGTEAPAVTLAPHTSGALIVAGGAW